MQLFQLVSDDFFKPLTGKYKHIYIDCLEIIYNTYKTELSFGVDKEVIMSKLVEYFDEVSTEEMVFEEDDQSISNSREKANRILRTLKNCNWIEDEVANDYLVRVNLFDHAATIIESFQKIIKNEEMEYQSVLSQIHGTLNNKAAYIKPYEYIIKRVSENTEELIIGLKKLNTMIKKRIDAITRDKTAAEIVEDFFVYQKDIGSKAYHRIKTSDNISHFRLSIIEKLRGILEDEEMWNKALDGFIEIEQVNDRLQADELLKGKVMYMISSFNNFDDIIDEIDLKNTKYISSAIARAQFLLSNSSNMEGKIKQILSFLADEFNKDDIINLNEESDGIFLDVFDIFPQNFIDGDSIYLMPITRKFEIPKVLDQPLGLSQDERNLMKIKIQEKNKRRFSKNNINQFVLKALNNNKSILASTLPLKDKRDLIRIIFISLYGRDKSSKYYIEPLNEQTNINGFKFSDFKIIRGDNDGDI
ncbi:MAG TPA: hypothetical protein GXZ90_04310 [Clostridiales bacterium]|nr:hypothetical protein [Clostridiales bacterium]